jgi:hypothetical protein
VNHPQDARATIKLSLIAKTTRRPVKSDVFVYRTRFMGALFRGAVAGWSMQRGNLLTDHRIIRGFVDIDLRPVLMLLGHVIVGKDRFDRALRHARVAIDTGISVNVKTIGQLVKSFDRTNRSAVRVLTINAHLNNNVGHSQMTPFKLDTNVYYLTR